MVDLANMRFGVGSHDATDAPTGDRDLCIMEAVAYMAGEPWSDNPACASPVIAAFLRSWNDALSDEDRDRHLPADKWVPRLVGSRGDNATEERRSYLALDWLIRVHAPAWLDLVPSLAPHAAALRALPDVRDMPSAQVAGSVVVAARDAAVTAARLPAAWDTAAWDTAAWDAARASAVTAAGAAAQAAAGAAAVNAARAAAARAAFRPTVEPLQESALDLLDRMLACGEHRDNREEKP